MSKPEIKEKVGGYLFSWKEEQIAIDVSRLKSHSDGMLKGELIITTSKADYNPHLSGGAFNFSGPQARRNLSKGLYEKESKLLTRKAWDEILEQLCMNVLRLERQGHPVKEIWTNADIKPPEYLVWPILPKFQPTILYGDGGVGKSELALIIATCLTLPWHENPLGLRVNSHKGVKVLYLDWESHENLVTWRLKCLCRGFGLPDYCINYIQCDQTFSDILPETQQKIVDLGIECVVIDSVGAAVSGDLNDAQTATGLIQRHLRQLNCTPLLIGHVVKGKDNGERTPFGSIFWRNAARSAWEMKATRPQKNTLEVGLFHRKANESEISDPLGFRIVFDRSEERTTVNRIEVRDTELAGELPLIERIRDFLQDGAHTCEEIAEGVGATSNYVKTVLNRNKRLFVRTNPEEKRPVKWGLLYESSVS